MSKVIPFPDLNVGDEIILEYSGEDWVVKKVKRQDLEFKPEICIYMKRKYTLEKYQLQILKWMENKMYLIRSNVYSCGIQGGFLACEMGLGKTIITLVHTKKHRGYDLRQMQLSQISFISPQIVDVIQGYCESRRTSLYVCPKTILTVISSEIEKFFGKKYYKYLIYHKDVLEKDYKLSVKDIEKYDIVITTYDNVRILAKKLELNRKYIIYNNRNRIEGIESREYEPNISDDAKGTNLLFDYPWENVIFDESHRFSNCKSDLFYSLLALNGRYKWCLSGTPIRNYAQDLFSQYKVMGYNSIINSKRFAEEYIEQKLHKYMLSMTNEEANIKLPALNEHNEILELEENEKTIYDHVLNLTKNAFIDFLSRKQQYTNVLTLFLRLRQICIAPYIILKESARTHNQVVTKSVIESAPKDVQKWVKDKNGTAGIQSKKMSRILEIIQSVDGKIVVFSFFKRVLDLIVYGLDKKNIKSLILDGDTKHDKRKTIISNFKENDIKVLLISYKAGGEGLNLAEASNNIILVENWWCPFVLEQARKRVQRRGQTKNVNVWKFIIKNSIEEHIEALCIKKIEISNDLIGKGAGNINKETLGRILQAS